MGCLVMARSKPCLFRNVKFVLALVVLALFATSCATDDATDGEVVGIVTEVTGNLSDIESFVVLDDDGDSHKFTPADGMTVVGAPASHLRDHILSGEPVRVIYHEGPEGELVADDVQHG